ncbi:SNF2 helicase associated domain-containing protein [Clostridium sp. D2Q-11]|uniref:SNF2 helicase associated domain-containing protein n=1 Tax=Anaeromonas frigoriresistens TaxID=2683708 RepID=A0A942UYN9_9FIRM|nr:DEAD/DEAH box helicase [Anaeromonas frigoriresistens]MBS4538032.1 SNF2 helicase associated domain-containing protein [Anaeromonas frigoriresistens]
MFNLNERIIQETSLNYKTLQRGKQYFSSGKIKDLHFYKSNLKFNGTVKGNNHYHVSVSFNPLGDFEDATCTCPAYGEYWGYCKHIIAILFKIMEEDKAGRFDKSTYKKNNNNILDILDYFRFNQVSEKTPVEVEFNYEYDPNDFIGIENASTLNLKMGEDKLYVVKSLKKFFHSIDMEDDIYFGKKFTFSPKVHTFKEEDQRIIDLLKELYDNETYINDYSYGQYSLFKGKYVTLTPKTLSRFFYMMKDRSFNGKILGRDYNNITILNEEIPIDFLLKEQGNNLSLNINHQDNLIPLDPNKEFFFSGENIYKIPQNQKDNLMPFYNSLIKKNNKILSIPKEYKERFISEVYPSIEKIGDVNIDDKVKSSIYNPDLTTEVYLDNEKDSIIANVKLVYGDISIDPFSGDEKESRKDNKILLRDMEKEKEILTFFETWEFKVSKNKIYLDDEEKVYEFLYNGLSDLQKISEVYYSNSFRKINIKDSSSFSGGIRLNDNTDMLEFNFEIEGINDKELAEVFNSIKQKKKYYRLKDGSFLPLSLDSLNKVVNIVDTLDLNTSDLKDSMIELPKYRALYLDEEIHEGDLHYFNRNLAFKELVQNIKEPGDMEYTIPKNLNNILRNYQSFGFKWLKTLSTYGLGGILADDMGLGKTLQVLTFLLTEKEEKGSHPSIIVVPTSLVYNWEDEINKFTPKLKTLVISGDKDYRREVIEDIMDHDIVITSYPLIRRDIDFYKDITFRYCILDEAQHIKNPLSQNAKSVKMLKGKNFFALTGTPIENSLGELWSIFDFIMPGYLSSHSKFLKKYERPIIKQEDQKVLDTLRKHIRPFILRRLKKDVLKELPDKIEHKLVAELTNDQKKIYLSYLKEIKGEIESEIKENGFNKSHIKILAGLTRLRQICCHPSTFIDNYPGSSGKLELLEEILEDSIESGHRVLLFSQFTSMLSIIKDLLDSKEIKYKYLDGSTKSQERGKLVKKFNNGDGDVFLISLKAGGTGLNLTGADIVIHFDPWWNPAVENQATDRAHRIGQKNSVQVMKLITKGTIEEKIFQLQEKKKRIVDAVIKPGEKLVSKMTEEELRNILDIE